MIARSLWSTVFRACFMLLGIFISTKCYAGNITSDYLKKENEVLLTVEKYCKADFTYDDLEKAKYVTYSKDRKKDLDPAFLPGIYFLGSDIIFVINSYKIGKPRAEKGNWIVPVVFSEIAERTKRTFEGGLLTKLTAPRAVTIEITVVHQKGKYKVYNPPSPRVSVLAALKYYQEQIDPYEKRLIPGGKGTEDQKKEYYRLKRDRDLLEAMENKFLHKLEKGDLNVVSLETF